MPTMADIELVSIRKGRGRIHLAVTAAPGHPVETLCAKIFPPDAVAVVVEAADCHACRRRQSDPGRVSSALFEGGRGSALLEMSLLQARERRKESSEPATASEPRPARRPPHLTIVPSERPEPRPRPAPESAPATPAESLAKPAAPEATALARGLYRTPGGVVIRIGVHSAQPRLERRPGNRVRIVAGDVDIDVPPGESP